MVACEIDTGGFIPCKLTRSKESGKRHTQRRFEVCSIVVIPNFINDMVQDRSGDCETESFLSFAIDAFATSNDEINSGVTECFDIVSKLGVN